MDSGGRSTVEDRRLRNSYHRVCYVFVEQAASECHWNWTAMGDESPTTNVRQKATVVCEVRGSQSTIGLYRCVKLAEIDSVVSIV